MHVYVYICVYLYICIYTVVAQQPQSNVVKKILLLLALIPRTPPRILSLSLSLSLSLYIYYPSPPPSPTPANTAGVGRYRKNTKTAYLPPPQHTTTSRLLATIQQSLLANLLGPLCKNALQKWGLMYTPRTEEIGLKIITTAKMSNNISREASYTSNTFSRESPNFRTSFQVCKRSPRRSKDLPGNRVDLHIQII